MENKLTPLYRKNNGPDPRYDAMLAEIAKHLPPDVEDPEQKPKYDNVSDEERYDRGEYEESYGE